MSFASRQDLLPLAILALVVVVYASSIENSFHYDDSHSIVENPHIRSLANLPRFFLEPETFSGEPAMAMYRPVLVSSFAVNYAADGYEPRGYLAANIAIHGVAAILVFLLLAKWQGRWVGLWGSVLFAVHPVQTQAVNYISSRSVSLSALGVLMAMCMVAHGRRQVWSVASYAFGLLAKSTAIVLLPLLLLYRRRRSISGPSAWFHVPFWSTTLCYLFVIWSNDFLPRSLAQEVRPWSVQWATQTKGLVYYCKLWLMPVGQSVEHAFVESVGFGNPVVLAALMLLSSIVFLTCRSLRAGNPAALGSAWFFACMVPTFVVPLNVLVSEHRLYLASVGVLLAIAGTVWLCGRRDRARLLVPALGLLALWSLLSAQRNTVWSDEYRLWSDAAGRAPGSFRVQSNLGLAQLNRGQSALAVETLRRAVSLNPRYGKTWSNIGLALEERGDVGGAEAAFRKALELQPHLAGMHNNLGSLLVTRGAFEEGVEVLQRATEIDSLFPQAHTNIGLAHHRAGNAEAARISYERALRLAPGDAKTLNNLGLLLSDIGATEEAVSTLRKAVKADPSYEDARISLRSIELEVLGPDAGRVYEILAAEFPHRNELWAELGKTHARNGAWKEAAVAFEAALKTNQTSPGVHR
jgi:Flp pilus assembly protein TadD